MFALRIGVKSFALRLTAGAAIDQRQHLMLVRVAAALLLARRLYALIVTDEGFVDLDDTPARTEWRQIAGAHGLADAVGKEPRRVVLNL